MQKRHIALSLTTGQLSHVRADTEGIDNLQIRGQIPRQRSHAPNGWHVVRCKKVTVEFGVTQSARTKIKGETETQGRRPLHIKTGLRARARKQIGRASCRERG